MSALPPYIIEPLWQQFVALLSVRRTDHPLGCHRSPIQDRTVFEELVEVLVFGCAYERIADESCLDTALRRRREEWISSGVMDELHKIVLDAYDRMIGLELCDISIDGCITKAPCGGEKAGKSSVDRGKRALKRSTVVDADGIPLGTVSAAANLHDSPLVPETLEQVEVLGLLLDEARVHLDRGYDSHTTREKLKVRSLGPMISEKGKPAPLAATKRWVLERTNSWNNAHKELVWCTERRGRVIDFWITPSEVIIIVRRFIRRGWTHYRWEGRPCRRP